MQYSVIWVREKNIENIFGCDICKKNVHNDTDFEGSK